MKQFLFMVLSSLLVSTELLAQTAPAIDLEGAKNELKQSNDLFGKAFTKGDSAGVAGLYHSEAKIYPPNMNALGQRSEMGHIITAMPGIGVKGLTLTSTEVFGSGDLIVELGTFEMSDGTKAMDSGKYMVLWKKENGKYKMYRDIWNSNNPTSQQ